MTSFIRYNKNRFFSKGKNSSKINFQLIDINSEKGRWNPLLQFYKFWNFITPLTTFVNQPVSLKNVALCWLNTLQIKKKKVSFHYYMNVFLSFTSVKSHVVNILKWWKWDQKRKFSFMLFWYITAISHTEHITVENKTIKQNKQKFILLHSLLSLLYLEELRYLKVSK